MPKRPKTPELPSESKFLTVAWPYPENAHLELNADAKTCALWLACILKEPNYLFALYHKPTTQNMIIIEVSDDFRDWRAILGAHKWSEVLKKPTEFESQRQSQVFFSLYPTNREVQKYGWKRINVENHWFDIWNANNEIIQYPYPPTTFCRPPPGDPTLGSVCRPLPAQYFAEAASKLPPVTAPRPVVGSAAYFETKASTPGSPGAWGAAGSTSSSRKKKHNKGTGGGGNTGVDDRLIPNETDLLRPPDTAWKAVADGSPAAYFPGPSGIVKPDRVHYSLPSWTTPQPGATSSSIPWNLDYPPPSGLPGAADFPDEPGPREPSLCESTEADDFPDDESESVIIIMDDLEGKLDGLRVSDAPEEDAEEAARAWETPVSAPASVSPSAAAGKPAAKDPWDYESSVAADPGPEEPGTWNAQPEAAEAAEADDSLRPLESWPAWKPNCPDHGKTCPKGICQWYSREKRKKEREKERAEKQANRGGRWGKGNGKGNGWRRTSAHSQDRSSGASTPFTSSHARSSSMDVRERPAAPIVKTRAPSPPPDDGASVASNDTARAGYAQRSASASAPQVYAKSASADSARRPPSPARTAAHSSAGGWGNVSDGPWAPGGISTAAQEAVPVTAGGVAANALSWADDTDGLWAGDARSTSAPWAGDARSSSAPWAGGARSSSAPWATSTGSVRVSDPYAPGPSTTDIGKMPSRDGSIAPSAASWGNVSDGPWNPSSSINHPPAPAPAPAAPNLSGRASSVARSAASWGNVSDGPWGQPVGQPVVAAPRGRNGGQANGGAPAQAGNKPAHNAPNRGRKRAGSVTRSATGWTDVSQGPW